MKKPIWKETLFEAKKSPLDHRPKKSALTIENYEQKFSKTYTEGEDDKATING